jgi:glutathione synthase/RimK-type ligase-like ATP-grasp enzyme
VTARIALATCRDAWRDDDDAGPTLDALAAAGAEPSLQVWDDASVDWAAFDLVVVRSTWDYVPRRAEFVAWTDRVATVTTLANPASVIRWNTDKRYLGDLAADGVPVVPTTFVDARPGGADPMGAARAALPPMGQYVVKPTVSAGAKDTVRYDEGDEAAARAAAHVAGLLAAGRDVMVQPYLGAVDTVGETGLVYLGGAFSHAFRKGALLDLEGGSVDGLYAREEITPRVPSARELDLGRQVHDAAQRRLDEPLLYARVDLLPGPDDAPVVLELELTEPSFFLATDPAAGDRFATACLDVLSGRG